MCVYVCVCVCVFGGWGEDIMLVDPDLLLYVFIPKCLYFYYPVVLPVFPNTVTECFS